MEFYLIDMAGIAFFSLMFYLYLVIAKQKDYTLRFISMYLFVFFAVSVIVQIPLKDTSFVQELSKFCFPLLFVVLYPLLARHKLGRKEINLLIFVSAIGIVPFMMSLVTVLAFCFFGQNM